MNAELKFDVTRRLVWRGDLPLSIEPKGLEVLDLLSREPGAVISADRLQREIWRRRHLGEGVISQTIYKLRRALGEDGLIQSVRGQGWRLTRPIERIETSLDDAVAAVGAEPVMAQATGDMPIAESSMPIGTQSEADVSHADVAMPPSPHLRWTWRLGLGLVIIPMLAVLIGATLWLRPSDQPQVPLIAVMPFKDQSPDQSLSPAATAIRDRLSMDVQGIPPFQVAREDAIAGFRGDVRNASQVRALMGANVVLRGQVAPLPGSAQGFELSIMIDDHSGNDLGFEKRYESGSGDLAPLLEQLRIDIYGHLTRADREREATARGTRNPDAWAAFLRAVSLSSANTPDSSRRALASLELAVELDPNFAEAWLELGGLLGARVFAPDDGAELKASRQRSLAALDRAIALSPDYVVALLTRSELRNIYAFDWAGAAADVALAEKLVGGPRADVWLQKARLAAALGDLETAVRLGDEAHALDPLSGARRNAGWHLLALERYSQARTYLLEEHRIRPWESSLNFYLGLCDVFEGQPRDALKRFQYADSDYRLTGLAIANIALGDQAEADRILGILIARMPDQAAYEIASVYGFAGNADEAFLWLDHAFEVGDGALEYLIYDPRFRTLRDDPRMHDRLRRLRHPKWINNATS